VPIGAVDAEQDEMWGIDASLVVEPLGTISIGLAAELELDGLRYLLHSHVAPSEPANGELEHGLVVDWLLLPCRLLLSHSRGGS
jgi:hypothetical protein